MNARENSKAISPRSLTGMLAVCLLGSCIAYAQKPAASKPAAAAPHPAAAPKAAPAASHAPASGAASHSPTTSTAGHTTTSTAGKSTTTSTAGHTTTSTAGKSTTTAGKSTTATAGHAPAAAASRAPAAGGHATPAASHSPAAGGRTASGHIAPAGHTTVHAANGSAVTRRPGGRVAEVHDARRGMDVHHGLSGGRSVRVEGRDGHRVYAERGGRGYVQGRYAYHGREYGHRTYYEHGRAYDRFYRGYPYHGVYVEMYSPAFYYRPAFYGWAYNPWVAPVPYAWGFAVNPWYGYYGAYFTPYPVYASASLWLTDYMISQTLAAAYQARVDAAAAANAALVNPAPLTPDVKNLIAAEVQRQIALANAESQTVAANKEIDPASSGIQRMLTDNIQHVFIAGKDLDVVDAAGTECAITEGDAIQLTGPPAADATAASLVVLSSKGGVECRKGATVTVAVVDLQDMQNHMRETIDAGMGELQTKQGKGGLPALPPSANAPPTKAPFAAEAPPPDPTAATQINAQMAEADKAEAEVVAQASGPSDQSGTAVAQAAPPAPPKQLGLGMSVDEVIAINGQPKNVLDLGNKKIYVYKDMKITFTAGKVTDMQ